MKFFNRKKKTAVRKPDNYDSTQMNADHAASVAMFAAVTPTFEPVTEDEQRAQAEADMADAHDELPADAPDVMDAPDNDAGSGVYEPDNSYDNSFHASDTGTSYDSGSYDTGSYDTGSYDSGAGGSF